MNKSTQLRLKQLNHNFYQNVGISQNASLDFCWEGWHELVKYVPNINRKIRVLDIGCGNGRFHNFLQSNNIDCEYVGLDFADEYSIGRNPNLAGNFVKADVTSGNWTSSIPNVGEGFDVVVAFGLLHNIPGESARKDLFDQMVSLVKCNGIFVFTTFEFASNHRLSKKILTNNQLQQALFDLGINEKDLQKGDFILEWKSKVDLLRYSHSFDDLEVQELTKNLDIIDSFLCDGKSMTQNKYFVTKIRN